jgi:hypothetical protein
VLAAHRPPGPHTLRPSSLPPLGPAHASNPQILNPKPSYTPYPAQVEVFKTCLDYWALFVADVYSGANIPTTPGGGNQIPQPAPGTTLEEAARMQEQLAAQQAAANGGFGFPAAAAAAAAGARPEAAGHLLNMQRRVVYGGVLQRLRALMVNRMAKPEVRGAGAGANACGGFGFGCIVLVGGGAAAAVREAGACLRRAARGRPGMGVAGLRWGHGADGVCRFAAWRARGCVLFA